MPLPGRGPVTGRSSMNTDPLLAGNRPATIRNSVVLPQPLGPNTEMKLNSGNSMLMSLSAATPGNQCLVNSVDLVCINCLLTRSTLILARGRVGACVGPRARSGRMFKPYPTAHWIAETRPGGRLGHCFWRCQGQHAIPFYPQGKIALSKATASC